MSLLALNTSSIVLPQALPEGEYEATIVSAEVKLTQSGKNTGEPYLGLRLAIVGEEHAQNVYANPKLPLASHSEDDQRKWNTGLRVIYDCFGLNYEQTDLLVSEAATAVMENAGSGEIPELAGANGRIRLKLVAARNKENQETGSEKNEVAQYGWIKKR